MSDTSEIAPAVPVGTPPVASPSGDTFTNFLAAIRVGAGAVYHKIVTLEGDVSAWATSPAVAPLVNDAVTFVSHLLLSHGIPVPAIELAAKAVLGVLGDMASNDVTVQSGGKAAAAPTP